MTEIKGFPLWNAFRKIIRNPVLKKIDQSGIGSVYSIVC